MGETLKVHSAQVISTVKDGLCVEQSASMHAEELGADKKSGV